MAMHSETYEAQESSEPASRTRARRPVATAASTPRSPDEEAMLLMMKLVERIEVAKSLAKIAAGLVTVSAVRAAEQSGLRSRYDHMRKLARAAAQAAVHVATHRAEAPETPEETEEAPPA